jgi:hypothetical protein
VHRTAPVQDVDETKDQVIKNPLTVKKRSIFCIPLLSSSDVSYFLFIFAVAVNAAAAAFSALSGSSSIPSPPSWSP